MRVLPIVAGLLLSSAVLRAAGLAGAVQAEAEAPEQAVAETGLICDGPQASASMLDAFRAREERLLAREAAVEDRARALGVAETEIDEKLAALGEAEKSLGALLDVAKSAASDDLAQLTAVYEAMKPAEAAAIFAQMDPFLAAGFLGMMRPESAASVMAGLEPGAAYAISALIAGRHMDVPTE